MSFFEILAPIGVFGAIIGFAIYGVLILMGKPIGYTLSGHSKGGLEPSIAGRYFMMLLLVLAFWIVGNYQALAIVFACFAFIAAFDAIFEPRHGGQILPHIGGLILALFFAFVFWSARSGQEG